MYSLRPYQKEAVEATLAYFRKQRDPAVIVLPTGAGKSLVIAELAHIARGRVLVLAHVKELVEQNHAKYSGYGLKAGIFSAGLERKDSNDKVIFGSIQSVVRAPNEFFQNFSLLIVDECHRISTEDGTQYLEVIEKLQRDQPRLCILGLTATPFRLGFGWIYQYHYGGFIRTESKTFFKRCIYEVSLGSMIEQRYLAPPIRIESPVASYDFSELYKRMNGRTFPVGEIEEILKDQQRVTPGIVDNIIAISRDRAGVMIFTSSIRHATEVLGYLPPDSSALILGETPAQEREDIVRSFKNRELKYLVNVSVLTTGFDAPHVDVIAILRPTESVSLYQQIVGRGLRLAEGKVDCLLLDYTGVGHEVLKSEIGRPKPTPDSTVVEVDCPACGHHNEFWGICDTHGDMVEHFGDTCRGVLEDSQSLTIQRCNYRFRSRYCNVCGTENDLTARTCLTCRNSLRDDESKLREARVQKDVHVLRSDSMVFVQTQDKQKRSRLEVRYYDYDGKYLAEYFYLSNENDVKVFFYNFLRMHKRIPEKDLFVRTIKEAIDQRDKFRTPLYVIAQKNKRHWRIREKIFLS
jgi:DNA repair protein RadD